MLFVGISITTSAQTTWNTVRIGGGGNTTSIQAHPLVPNLFFITADVGTPYRWNNSLVRWEGMFYKTSAENWEKRGAAARLAFDPSDPTGNILYTTVGGAWSVNGTVLKSTDRGNTWTDCQIVLDIKPNNEQGAGQRIAVDPQNSKIVYVTTRASTSLTATNGTFKSTNAGAPGSWSKVNDLYGSFVQFDKSSGTVVVGGLTVTKDIYIGTAEGVYRSTNGGSTFTLISGSPANTRKASMHSSGVMYVSSTTGIYKWRSGAWVNITPPTTGAYSAVAANPKNANQVVVSSTSFSPYAFIHYRSNDGGQTWTKLGIVHDKTEVPWFETSLGQATGEFCWDPFDAEQDKVWMTDFFFASVTQNIWANAGSNPAPVTWKTRAVGHEETVSIGNLLCPPSGVNLLMTCLADLGGWDHKSLTAPPAVGMQRFFPWRPDGGWGNITGVAVQETNPNFIARVGRAGWDGPGYAGYSADGGTSYTQFSIPSGVAGGRVAVSATNETIVWLPQSGTPQKSTNRGASWTTISTLPSGIIGGGSNVFSSGPVFPLAADKVNGNKFYVYKNSGGMYVSTNAGSNFTVAGSGLPGSYYTNNLTVETTPGKEGDIWVGSIEFGLYHSTNSGGSFQKISNVQSAKFIAVGKASSATPTVPAVYVFGTVNNIANSLFRSNNNGATWTNLGTPLIGRDPLSMAADRRVYGRIFFGTGGNGFFAGSNTSTSRIASVSDIEEESVDAGRKVDVYPNPIGQDRLMVKLNGYQDDPAVKLVMNNLSGKKVYSNEVYTEGRPEQSVEIDIHNLEKGLYILSVLGQRSKKKIKVIIK
jgi:hypothetical protein